MNGNILIGHYDNKDNESEGVEYDLKSLAVQMIDVIGEIQKDEACVEMYEVLEHAKCLVLQAQLLSSRAIYIGRDG